MSKTRVQALIKLLPDGEAFISELNATTTITGKEKEDLLVAAVRSNCPAAVECLLEKGANPNAMSLDENYNDTPVLIKAIVNKNEKIVELLLNYKANPNIKAEVTSPRSVWIAEASAYSLKDEKLTTTPVTLAYDRKYDTILQLLLENEETEIYSADSGKSREMLLWAVRNNNPTLVERLLDKGAPPNARDDSGTALLDAIVKENPAIVKLLLDKGANPSACNRLGETALMLAVKDSFRFRENIKDRLDILKLLLEKNFDFTIKNAEGKTVLDIVKHEDNYFNALIQTKVKLMEINALLLGELSRLNQSNSPDRETRKDFLIKLQSKFKNFPESESAADLNAWWEKTAMEIQNNIDEKQFKKEYKWYEKIGKGISNAILTFTGLGVPLKKAVSGLYFFPMAGKTQVAVEEVLQVAKKKL